MSNFVLSKDIPVCPKCFSIINFKIPRRNLYLKWRLLNRDEYES